jgi:hypothetical protein
VLDSVLELEVDKLLIDEFDDPLLTDDNEEDEDDDADDIDEAL